MCRGNLQYFGDCGHEKTFHPTEHCPSYCPDQAKCLGTLTVCHQTVIHSPAICVRCADRVEATMTLERDLAIRQFEDEIEALDHAMTKVNDKRNRRAMASERAAVTKALADFSVLKDKELAVFQREQGRDAPGRAEDLPHDWFEAL